MRNLLREMTRLVRSVHTGYHLAAIGLIILWSIVLLLKPEFLQGQPQLLATIYVLIIVAVAITVVAALTITYFRNASRIRRHGEPALELSENANTIRQFLRQQLCVYPHKWASLREVRKECKLTSLMKTIPLTDSGYEERMRELERAGLAVVKAYDTIEGHTAFIALN